MLSRCILYIQDGYRNATSVDCHTGDNQNYPPNYLPRNKNPMMMKTIRDRGLERLKILHDFAKFVKVS